MDALTFHYHLHLEPAARMARRARRKMPDIRSREEFFSLRNAGSGFGSLSLTAGVSLIREIHAEQASEQLSYIELRVSPRRFIQAPDDSLSTVLIHLGQAASELRDPVVQLILVINRDWPGSLLSELEGELSSGLPVGWAGLDLAGDELRYPGVGRFARPFRVAEASGLGLTVHAGEFGGADSVWEALDILGAHRIGHGLPVGRSKALQQRLVQDNVLVEACLSSNLRFGIARPDAHPLKDIAASGVPFSINADVPVLLGTTLRAEEELAAALLHWVSADIAEARARVWQYRFCRS